MTSCTIHSKKIVDCQSLFCLLALRAWASLEQVHDDGRGVLRERNELNAKFDLHAKCG